MASRIDEIASRLDLRRHDGWWGDRAEVVRALGEQGWPLRDAWIEAEVLAGGYGHPRLGVFGLLASIRYLMGAAPWERDDLLSYGPRPHPQRSGEVLLPLYFLNAPWLWIDERGEVFYGLHDRAEEVIAPAFDDVARYWEALGLLDGRIAGSTYLPPPRRPRLEVEGHAGKSLAAALGFDAYPAASGAQVEAYAGPEGACVVFSIAGVKTTTDLVTDTDEGVVLALQAALEAHDDARILTPSPLEAELLAALPSHHHEVRSPLEHEYLWGRRRAFEEA